MANTKIKLQPSGGADMSNGVEGIGLGQGLEWWDIGGAVAGSVAYALMQEHVPVRRTMVHVFVGTAAAIFLSPLVSEFLQVRGEYGSRGVTFLFGLFGIISCRTMISWFEKYAPDALGRLISRWLGPMPSPPVANPPPRSEDSR